MDKDEMTWILDDNFLKFQEIIKENFLRIANELSEDELESTDKKKRSKL